MKPTILHARGHQAARDRARRQAAREHASQALSTLLTATEANGDEFQIEALRSVTRLASALIAEKGDTSRARGILAGAEADLSPTWVAGRSNAMIEADAVFGGAE